MENEDLHDKAFAAAKANWEKGDGQNARTDADKLLSTPGYEQDPYTIRLLPAVRAQEPESGLALVRPAPPDGEPIVSAEPQLSPELTALLAEQAKSTLEHMRQIAGHDYYSEYSAWLNDSAVSADKSRIVFSVTVEEMRDSPAQSSIEETFWQGAIVLVASPGDRTGELVTYFRALYTKGAYDIHDSPYSLSLDAKGQRILLASDRLAVIPVTHAPERVLLSGKDIRYARFLADDRLVFYYAADEIAGVIDSETGKELGRVSFAERDVKSVTLVSDDTFLVKYEDGPTEPWLFYRRYAATQKKPMG